MNREEIREIIGELEGQTPRNLEEFEFREKEISKLREMLPLARARGALRERENGKNGSD